MGDNGTYFKKGLTINLCCFCDCRALKLYFPPGLLEDLYYYMSNNHGFFSIVSAEPGHPYRRVERNFSFLALGSLTYFGVVGGSFYGTTQTNSILFQVALVAANFMLTNVFQVLFACSCLFGGATGAEKRNALTRCCETSGTVLGCLIALTLSGGMLLGASLLCADGGVALASFVVQSQIPSIGIGVFMIFIQYIPYVLHLSDIPLIGDMTLTGSWFLDKFEASNEHGELWAKEEGEERHRITRKHFRFLEINFFHYCCPLIPYFTTDAEFDPGAKIARGSEVKADVEAGGGPSIKVHPSDVDNKDKADVLFDDIKANN